MPDSTLDANSAAFHVKGSSKIHTAVCRLVLDEYQQSKDGSYHLTNMATDMFRLMRREGLRVSLVPDVMAATTGAYNGSRGIDLGTYIAGQVALRKVGL